MPRLALYLLGPPRLELDGEPVRISRRKVVALLAYLAVTRQSQSADAPASVHSRESLVTLLSPELDQSRARNELRRTLSVLKRLLGEGDLVVDLETIGLNPQALWLDVDRFHHLLAGCDAHNHSPDEACPDCIPLLEGAVALYQGDFMAGFTLPDSLAFEEWQLFQAEGLRRALASALERLLRWHGDQRAYETAIAHARRWLALDPMHEPAQRKLMALYAIAGQRAAALRQYRACVRALEQELGIAPSAETHALYEQIRVASEISPVTLPQSTPAPATLPLFLAPEAPPMAVVPPVFVARERELARLDGFLDEALAGQGRVVFITGGPGRGKTALLRAFAHRAMEAHPDLLVASGTCNAFSGVGDPYLPLREVMRMLTGDVESRWEAGTISTRHARRLWAVLPGTVQALLDHGPHLIEVLIPGADLLSRAQTLQTFRDCAQGSPEFLRVSELRQWLERRRAAVRGLDQEWIFQQVADTLAALSSSYPLLLTLDDLQWVDTASAPLLFHLGRQLGEAGGRVLILGAYRPEEVALDRDADRHPMQKVLSEFRRHYGDVWVDLAAADQVEDRAFVDAYLDNPANPFAPNRLGEEFRAALAERTGGHPLFTIELLAAMRERGELIQDAEGTWIAGPALEWERLPTRVEAAIQERIERLDAAARDLLAVASVEGETFTAQAVAQVQGLPEREVLHMLSRELGPAGQRLVREAGEVRLDGRFLSRYQFGHALFQTYLYEDLSAGERRLLHGEVATALERLYKDHTDQLAPALARHYLAAGRRENAAAYAQRAGELAYESYAYESAIEHHRTVLALSLELGDRKLEARALDWLSIDQAKISDFVGYEKYYERVLHLARELGDRDLEAATLRRNGWMSLYLGRYAQSEASFHAAREIYQECGESGRLANVLGGLGRFHREFTGDFERSKAFGEQAVLLSREAGVPFDEAIGEFVIGFALHYLGDYCAAQPHMQRFVKMAYNERGRKGDCALGLVGVGLNALALGEYSDAAAHLERSRRTFHEFHFEDHDDDAWAQSALALLHHQMRNDRTAREYAEHALCIHRKSGYDYRTATALTRLGHALTALGDLTEATAAYQEALDLRRQMGQRHLAPEPLAGLARVALSQDDRTGALAYVKEILSHLETGLVDGTDEPLRIYLTCYRVLHTNDDPCADEILATAHGLLQERAAKIEDEELRRSFLENVTAHREIVEAHTELH